jgi:site-specific DNA-cytosine methylase
VSHAEAIQNRKRVFLVFRKTWKKMRGSRHSKSSSQSRRIAKRMERDQKLKEQEQKTIVKPPVGIFQEEKQTQPENHPPKPEQPKNLILSGREAEMAGYIRFRRRKC